MLNASSLDFKTASDPLRAIDPSAHSHHLQSNKCLTRSSFRLFETSNQIYRSKALNGVSSSAYTICALNSKGQQHIDKHRRHLFNINLQIYWEHLIRGFLAMALIQTHCVSAVQYIYSLFIWRKPQNVNVTHSIPQSRINV